MLVLLFPFSVVATLRVGTLPSSGRVTVRNLAYTSKVAMELRLTFTGVVNESFDPPDSSFFVIVLLGVDGVLGVLVDPGA